MEKLRFSNWQNVRGLKGLHEICRISTQISTPAASISLHKPAKEPLSNVRKAFLALSKACIDEYDTVLRHGVDPHGSARCCSIAGFFPRAERASLEPSRRDANVFQQRELRDKTNS